MQPLVAHLTSKIGGATDTFFVTIKAQKRARQIWTFQPQTDFTN